MTSPQADPLATMPWTDVTAIDRREVSAWVNRVITGRRPRREERGQLAVKITYDTVTDSISCPDLTPEQTRVLQAELSAALMRNDPVRTVAGRIMAAVTAAQQN